MEHAVQLHPAVHRVPSTRFQERTAGQGEGWLASIAGAAANRECR